MGTHEFGHDERTGGDVTAAERRGCCQSRRGVVIVVVVVVVVAVRWRNWALALLAEVGCGNTDMAHPPSSLDSLSHPQTCCKNLTLIIAPARSKIRAITAAFSVRHAFPLRPSRSQRFVHLSTVSNLSDQPIGTLSAVIVEKEMHQTERAALYLIASAWIDIDG